MLKNYLLSAWQNLLRQKLFTLINILGLAIGLTVFILIFLYVEKEYSWDRHWDNADRIYWLTYDFRFNETSSFKGAAVPYPMTSLVEENFPDAIEASARIYYRGDSLYVGQDHYPNNISLADRAILDVFDLEVVSGSLEETLAVPGRIAIRQEDVSRYFGSENPLGKTLSLEVTGQDVLFDYLVTAVFSVPEETSARIRSLSLLEESALPELAGKFGDWTGTRRVADYFLLRDGVNVDAMNRRLVDLVNTSMPRTFGVLLDPDEPMSDFHEFAFAPLVDAHFDASLRTDNSGNRNKVAIFALIGILVLVMGSTNFVILATARSDDRKREVGIRKVLGANKKQLIVQYLGESLIYTFMAMMIATGLVVLTLPFFSTLIGQTLSFDLLDASAIFMLMILMLCVGVLGGLYPAAIMANFSVVSVFNPASTQFIGKAVTVRGLLACLQFAIAIGLIITTLVLYFQLNFIRGLDLGFETDNIYVLQMNDAYASDKLVPLINELNNIPDVEQVAGSSLGAVAPGAAIVSVGSYKRQQNQAETDFEGFWVDYDFFDLYGMQLLAGRIYDPALDTKPDSQAPGDDNDEGAQRPIGKILVNRQMIESLGFASPEQAIGEIIYQENPNQEGEMARNSSQIIGVVENSKYRSLREAPIAEIYSLNSNRTTILSLKYLDAAEDSIRARVEAAWNNVMPDNVFQGGYLEQNLIEAYSQERNEGRLLLTFSGLAIFIAAMGLYGLAAYTVKKSIKEVGIRKVLGARFSSIMLLYAWRFSKPVLIANVIAWPLAVWAMLRWLQRFPDQIDYVLLVPICLFATILALVIAWSTIGLITARAARANPVESLRYE